MTIDHIELFVPSRFEAAAWYRRVLGFEIVDAHRDWADTEGGPLMISNDGGQTLIALFRGPAQGEHAVRGLRRLAVRADAAGFVDFLRASGTWRGEAFTADDVSDHDRALSLYFDDPYGTPLEVTTYEPDAVRTALGLPPA
ncbi:MAG: VOC family protein [Acidobacteriota bacterium]